MNEAQEQEIMIGTDIFDEPVKDDSMDSINDSYWYECGIIPNEVNSVGFRYTQFHIDLVIKWLSDIVLGKTPENQYVVLITGAFPNETALDLTKLCARITAFEYIDGKLWIKLVPVGPMAKEFVAYNEYLKIVTFMIGSVSKVDGINTVSEDAQMMYFFLTSKNTTAI
jgi:hypothetical protein